MNFDGIWEGIVVFFIICIVLAVGVGIMLAYFLPEFWTFIKPYLHTLTS
jgi:hypothetical protein